MLFNSNPYQQSVYLTSANSVCATVYDYTSKVTSYFNLSDINKELQDRNAVLEMELVKLNNEINEYKMLLPDAKINQNPQQFDFVVAHVISNSISESNNYITINRGLADGVKTDMGVVDRNGVVGIVNVTGNHSARIISLLNPNMKLSCKLKNSGYFGSMVWDCKSPQYSILEELPKHMRCHLGDTIVTSGYSSVFPEGLIVGTVSGQVRGSNDSFVSLRIKLSTNFCQLGSVRVITNNLSEELKMLETKDTDNEQKNEGFSNQ